MLRPRALLAACLAATAACAAAWAAQPPTRLDVLRADAHGTTLDVLLRIQPAAELADTLGPDDFAVYLAPASLPAAEAATPPFRIRRLFAKRLDDAWYLDLRQSPPGIGGVALQLVVHVKHGGRLLAAHHLGQFLGAPADALDVALVIDESLSMTRTDPEWLRIAAAKTFVDLARRSTRIGHIALVAFNDKARTLVPLTPTAQPDALYKAINNISSMGQTDMDAALAEARKVLEQSPSPNKVALLLSDGKDEPGVYENAHRAFAEQRWRIYTVGLSKLADAEVLQRIAAETGGDYHSAPTNAELQDIFSRICVTLHRKVPICSRSLSLQAQAPLEEGLFVDDTISALTVRLNSRDSDIGFTLRDTQARLLTPDLPKADQTAAYGRKADYQHYDLWDPVPGRCVARLASPRPAQVGLAATAVTPLLLRAFPLRPAYRRGEPIELAVSLANADTVLADARVEARVTTPDGATVTRRLFDDGQHGDTAPKDGVFAATLPGLDTPGACVLRIVAEGTTPAGHRFERELEVTAAVSTEDMRPPRLALSAGRLDLGAIESGERAEASLGLRLEPRGAAAARITSSDPRLTAEPATLGLTTREATARIVFAAPPEAPSGQTQATLRIETPAGKAEVPVAVRVVRPSLTLSAETVNFGEVVPGQTVERHLTLTLAGLRPREVTLAPMPLAGPPATPSMAVTAAEQVALKPGEPAAVQIRLGVPPTQAPGNYRGELALRSPLGEHKVACTVQVGAANTFQIATTLDLERVAIGTSKEAVIEVASLVAAEQRVEMHLPEAGAGWRLAVEPQSLALPPNGKGRVTLRLTVEPEARPGPIQAVVAFRGPSRGASLEARAVLFRPPHESVAFEPAVVDVGRLQAGISEEVRVRVKSLVDEPQDVAIEGANFPPDILAATVRPERLTLDASGAVELALTLRPASGPDEVPFEGKVTARGRSLPATLLVRGSVFTPPGTTFAIADPVLDFGAMSPGQTAELALVLQSIHPRVQRVSLAAAPSADGVTLRAQRAGAVLLPGVAHPIGIQVSVAQDAPSGEREAAWEVRGPGSPATFRVRVEVVAPPPPAVTATKPGGIGWAEGLLLFLLLCLLLAMLALTYLLARRVIRSHRMPRMAKYFAVSALLHVAALFVTLDIFLAEKVRKQEIGPLFQVGLKALAPSAFSSQQASAADELRAQAERERRLEAERRQQEAARVARALLESERRKLNPAEAQLDRPAAQEKPELAPRPPGTERFTVEELAQIVEDLREASQAPKPAEPETPQAAELEAQRMAQVRALSRQQLEEAVRAALQPKMTTPERAAADTAAPGLAQAQATERMTLAPEELVPAIEALQQEAARTERQAAGGASPAAEATQPHKASQPRTLERGTGSGERVALADARRPGEAARALPQPRLPEPSASGAGAAAAADRPAEPPAFATPDEVVPAIEGAARVAVQPSSPSGAPGATRVAAARPQGEMPLERGAEGAGPLVVGAARPATERGPAAPEPAVAALIPRSAERAGASPREAPIAFASPEEQPVVDPMVRPPAARGELRSEPGPVAVAPHRAETGARGGAGREAAKAPMAAAPGPIDPAPGPSAVGRPAPSAPILPERADGVGQPSPRHAPGLEEVQLVEGPLTAVRRDAGLTSSEPSPQTVVAIWRLQGRGEETGRLAMAGSESIGISAPRGEVAARPSAAGSAPEVAVAWPGAGRRESPNLADLPQEGVAPTRRMADAPALAADAPAQVGVSRGNLAGRIERGGPPTLPTGRVLAARPAEAVRGPAAEARGALPDAPAPRLARPQTPEAVESHPEEPVSVGARAAAAGRDFALGEVPIQALRAEAGPTTTEAPRETPPTRLQTPRPRDVAQGPTRIEAATRLLLPALASRGQEAGAVVGDASGSVKSFVLTTVKYGGGAADWDVHRTAMPFLAWQLRERVGFNLETDVLDVPLDSPRVMNSPWIYMTGHKDFRLTGDEVASLRRYLMAGGTLWAEDCTHEDDPTWDRAFRREIARVLPRADGYQLAKIERADDHPLLRSCFDLSQGYKGYWPPPGDKYRQSFLEGIEINGRLGVIYTRNDYGCGLEIKPDTHPGKVSLSSLSPAEMQEASFLMASNIVVYALTGGRGAADRGLAGRAADSLRRQREAAAAQRDPYEDAPATLFDSFGEEHWAAEETWDKAGAATLRYLRHADPAAAGRRLAVSFRLGRDDAKAVIIRDLPQEQDLSRQDRCYLDVESRLEGGARLSIALVTMPDWKYFESRPAFIKPGRQRIFFDLRAPTWKTGEPVPEGETEYSRRPANLEAVRRVAILLYPIQPEGTVVLDRIELRSKP
ncbi:MAG TPA: DUF4159 domain-containing protein [Planctomycetota bacterium]|nr:DUF4159 domain-containing protein [Planctomycetota bacterium]